MFSTCWDTWRSNEEDDYARGTALWEESLALAREIGRSNHVRDNALQPRAPGTLAETSSVRGRCEEALPFAQELGSSGVELAYGLHQSGPRFAGPG